MSPLEKPPVIPSPPAQKPFPTARPTMVAAGASKVNIWELLFRLVTFTLLAVSIFVAWWMYSQRLVPRQQQSRELSSKVSRFSMEVDKLDRQWSDSDASLVNDKYGQVRSNLFLGPAALESWWNDLKEQAAPLTLELNIEFGTTKAELIDQEKIARISTTLALEVHPAIGLERTESPYQRVLRLCQRLTTGDKRADLAQLTVVGGTNSATRALMVLDLWAGEEEKGK